ncbi:hypothetical protein PAEPH01_2809, partial [Pancytospora epiphaga]
MWNQREVDTEKYDAYLFTCVPDTSDQSVFPSAAEVIDIIKYLPNWKAAGPDGVFNFFIKKCSSLHEYIYTI